MSNEITPSGTVNHYKDRLFISIFGKDNDQSKKWRLNLYNALNGTNYTDPDALELNTIENVIYLTMRNDVSFLVDSQMTLFEQQSTFNPNMPLRGFMYFAQLYQMHLAKLGRTLFRSTLTKIPNPKFIVFYNGTRETGDRELLRLSDAFEIKDDSGQYEWTAEMININPNHNKALQQKCKPLYDYVRYVARVNENKKHGMQVKEAVDKAVEWAIRENLLDGYFRLQKEEILANSLTEFDEEEAYRDIREDGYEEGYSQGISQGASQKAIEDAENLLRMGVNTIEQISQAIGLPLEKIQEIAEQLRMHN
ncbi:MAG: hypothetical protein J6Y60_13905 [Treponema sp.]|nr:hypothetical protein [Treponema sp.]